MATRRGGRAKVGFMEPTENRNAAHAQRKTNKQAEMEDSEDLQVTFSKVKKRPKRRVFNCPFCDDSFPKDNMLICHLVAKHSLQINIKSELPKLMKNSGPTSCQRSLGELHGAESNNVQEETIPEPIEEVQEPAPAPAPALDEISAPSTSENHPPNSGVDVEHVREEGSLADTSPPQLAAELEKGQGQIEKVLLCGICGILFISAESMEGYGKSESAFNTKCLSCNEAFQQLSRSEAEHIAINYASTENHTELPASAETQIGSNSRAAPTSSHTQNLVNNTSTLDSTHLPTSFTREQKTTYSISARLRSCAVPLIRCDSNSNQATKSPKIAVPLESRRKRDSVTHDKQAAATSKSKRLNMNLRQNVKNQRMNEFHNVVFESLYQCENCHKIFEGKGSLTTHKKKFCPSRNAGLGPLKKEICSSTSSGPKIAGGSRRNQKIKFTQKNTDRKMPANSTSNKALTCPGCFRSYSRSDSLLFHQKWHCPERKGKGSLGKDGVKCNLCFVTLSSPTILRQHKKKVCQGGKAEALEKQKTFGAKRSTDSRKRTNTAVKKPTQTDKQDYTCKACSRSFPKYKYLLFHQKWHCHKGKNNNVEKTTGVECKFCFRKLGSPSSLRVHVLRHCRARKGQVTEKPVSRDLSVNSKKPARTKPNVNAKTKTDKKVYTCQKCSSSFTQKSSLNTHETWHCLAKKDEGSRVESGIKCTLCHRILSSPSNLWHHQRKSCPKRRGLAR